MIILGTKLRALPIVWKGELASPPSNPEENWVYRDTDNGYVYIYNGTAWGVNGDRRGRWD